jgi:hypothetical protein
VGFTEAYLAAYKKEINTMLGIRNYTKKYIESCRARVDSDLAAYRKMAAAAKNDPTAKDGFETIYFNNMVMLLDTYFVHRLRTVEGKDGNPLNEVRMLSNSMMTNDNILAEDTTIKYDPAKAVLKYKVGEPIQLKEADFLLLSKAYFSEIKNKFA